jgi:hypothetical protein
LVVKLLRVRRSVLARWQAVCMATVAVLTPPLEDPGVFRGQLPQIWRRIAQKLLFPSLFWPAAWRMYPMHPAAHVMEHFPAVDSQLALDPDRQLPGSFVQDLVRDVLLVFLDVLTHQIPSAQ